uniref:CMRF35-like molecule 5 n=1 Tax=Lepisosteus oculatus TaxID=7918 RepID=W5N1G3_LEPOC|nr:PREDICTED: CMRF35-like molecule 5 [Lepisosteus oculatus]
MKLLAIMAVLSGAHSIIVLNSKDVTGWVHGTVTVQCSYSTENQLSNQVKYWCKGHNLLTCTILVRTDDSTTHDRISISDNKTEAMVSITMKDLQERDEGDYWCGVSLPGPDDAEQVHIKVNRRKDSGANESSEETEKNTTDPRETTPVSSGIAVWSVVRWLLFCMMLAGPVTVTCWQTGTRRTCPPAAHT